MSLSSYYTHPKKTNYSGFYSNSEGNALELPERNLEEMFPC